MGCIVTPIEIRIAGQDDLADVRSLMLSCWDTISQDGDDRDSFTPSPQRESYILAVVAGLPAAVLSLSSANGGIVHGHIHVHPGRRKHSDQIGRALLAWLREQDRFRALVVYIPTCCPNVRRFVQRMGFQPVGCVPRAFRKDGEDHDMDILHIALRADT